MDRGLALGRRALLGRRSELEDELVGEELRAHGQRHPVEDPGQPPRAVPEHVEDVEGEADRLRPPDLEARALGELSEAAPGEEPQVRLVEDAPLVVVEGAENHPCPRVPVGEVGDAGQDRAVVPQAPAGFDEEHLGLADVLEHVGAEDEVVVAAHLVGDPPLQVGAEEAVHPLPHARDLHGVQSRDLVTLLAEQLCEATARTPEVEDAAGRLLGQPGADAPV